MSFSVFSSFYEIYLILYAINRRVNFGGLGIDKLAAGCGKGHVNISHKQHNRR